MSKTAEISHSEHSEFEENPQRDSPIDKSLNRKYDLHLLPILFLVYLFSFMDRASIGNASINGLAEDLNLQGNEYNTALALFFVVYMIVDVPAAWAFKLCGPATFIGVMILCFGICTTCLGFVKTAPQLYAVRCLLGFFEGGLTPCLFLYIGLFYRRFDTQRRVAYFYVSAPLSGAFGGLLASGLGQIKVNSYRNWPWIFFIEGAITICVGMVALTLLPNFPSSCKFLSAEEMAQARIRSGEDDVDSTRGLEKEKFSWEKTRHGLLDWNTFLLSLASIGTYCNVYAYSLFSPSIIKNFGYDTVHSQLLSVPPYILAVLTIFVTSSLSDRLKIRGPFMIGSCLLQLIGWTMQATCKSTGVRYFALYLTAAGVFSEIPPLSVWLCNNLHPHYARATGLSVSVAAGTTGGIIATFSFLSSNIHQGYYIQLGMSLWSASCAGILMWINSRENGIRMQGGRDAILADPSVQEHELGSRHPSFKLSL